MKIEVLKNYDAVMERATEIVAAQVREKPNTVLGLPTGSTPIGLYNGLIREYEAGKLDFYNVTTFNLDEYYPIDPRNSQSYRYFMNDHLFHHVNIPMTSTHVPNGNTSDPEAACREYEAAMKAAGGVDLQVLGVGRNGHIGFNEPAEELVADTHLTGLTADTIDANSRFFASADEVPKQAVTMGMASILRAKQILILICGEDKKEALKQLKKGNINTQWPVTLLNLHDDVIVLCDEAANA